MKLGQRVTVGIGAVAAIVLLSFSAVSAQERRIEIQPDTDYFGFDLRAEKDIALDRCQAICLSNDNCRAFTYNRSARWCFLKSDYGAAQPFPGAVAGRVVSAADGPDIGSAPELAFISSGLLTEARKMRDSTGNAPIDTGLWELRESARQASARGEFRQASQALRAALPLDASNSEHWQAMSRASLQITGDGRAVAAARRDATAAAINAYQLSRTAAARAAALDLLAKALEQREYDRPALKAYEASLALVDSAQVRADYRDLRARRGFRVVDHTVDADGNEARICVRLSEPLLPAGVDYRSFVQIDGRAADTVTAQGQQICAAGLQHGRSYVLTLRAGLPSAVGEDLAAPVAIETYVRDRAPAVRFTGDRFVLPGGARRGVPVVSVNTAAIEIELYRIGERSLAAVLAESRFLRQLDGYDVRRVRESLGEPVWQGTLDVASQLNEETVTSFPIDTAVPDRRPGVYVLLAKVADSEVRRWDPRATQWLVVSDIGLTALSGTDGLHVFARSLATAKPVAGVQVSLIARNNEVLGKAVSDGDGRVLFPPGLVRGRSGLAPAVVTADSGDDDFVFLDMTKAGFDFSDRGVTGRPAPGPIDIFAVTERGIYRAGETVHLTALARDDAATAIGTLPLTFIVQRPDGKESRRLVREGGPQGGYDLDLTLPVNTMHGAWTVGIHADPDAAALAEVRFLVEDFRPDRVAFDLRAPDHPLVPGEAAEVGVDGRFLYGAPAAGLALEGDLRLRSVRDRAGHPGFRFGLADEETLTNQVPLGALPVLDDAGQAKIDVVLGALPATSRPLAANLAVRLVETGGRAVERTATMPVRPAGMMIGIRPEFPDDQVGENSTARFRVIAVAPDGTRQSASGLRWSLLRIERDYQWYRENNRWRYEPVEYTTLVQDGDLDVTADGAEVAVTVGWGRYRLDVETDNAAGPASSVEFTAGWYVSSASTETPDGLEIALDRDSYRPGDRARLQISPRFAGEVLVTVADEKLREVITAQVPPEGTEITIPVGSNWGAGAYVTATLIRPGDGVRSRLPARAVGVQWLSVAPRDRALDVRLDAPEEIRPRTTLDIPVRVGGARSERARIVVAAVDVGILNLTRHAPPDPLGWYFGQRRMGVEMRDLYGRLIDGSLGVSGRIRTGGDGPGPAIQGSVPREKLVALHSGIVELDADGRGTVSFDIPQFNGTVRLMAMAWTRNGVGRTVEDVIVRDPVVVTSSMPQFLAPGDVSRLRLDIANTAGPAGDYRVTVEADGAVSLEPPSAPVRLALATGGRSAIETGLRAGEPGSAEIIVTVSGPDGLLQRTAYPLTVRPAALPSVRRIEVPLAAGGGALTVNRELLQGSFLDGASVSVSVSRSQFDVPALLMALDRYPFGCTEQITSRALPLLYVDEFETPPGLLDDGDLGARIQTAIDRVLGNQSASGSFGLWAPGDGDLWLDAYVTGFLTRALEQGYAVPAQSMRLALDNLQNRVNYATDTAKQAGDIAYALYVLARNRRAAAGDLRYYADRQLNRFDTPIATAQLAAALALYGDAARAERVFAAAFGQAKAAGGSGWRAHFGSVLRDDAAMLAFAGESRPVTPLLPDMVRLVAERQEMRPARTTQEQAWMLLAARAAISADAELSLRVDGVPHSGGFGRRIEGRDLLARPLRVENTGTGDVTAVVTAIAAPVDPTPAGGDGFIITRDYYDLQGNAASIEAVEQNQRFVAVLTIEQTTELPAHIVVTDLLPAGLEIDNPRLIDSANTNGFGWLGETTPAHSEFRDDRFVAAFDAAAGERNRFTVAYVVRAAVPGVYRHPAARVEDMYRPQFAAQTAARWMEVRDVTP